MLTCLGLANSLDMMMEHGVTSYEISLIFAGNILKVKDVAFP